MRIKRVSDSEKYNITADWLSDFAKDIVKEGNYLDRIRERKDFEPKEKFATIEEKMKDIKSRIGFLKSEAPISKEAKEDSQDYESEKQDEEKNISCDCGKCKSCKDEDAFKFILKVLNYAKGILSENPSMMPEIVISKCRSEIPQFYVYEKSMCPDKLRENISKMCKKKEDSPFEYMPSSEIFDFEETDEDEIR